MKKLKIYALDVWGNDSDGFEVNDRHCTATIEIADDADERTILDALIDAGLLIPEASPITIEFEFNDDGSFFLYERATRYPIYDSEIVGAA